MKDHRRQVAGSRGRQKVIHRESKKATVKAGKRLVTPSGRSDNRLITRNPKVQAGNRQKASLVRQAKTIIHGRISIKGKQSSE